MKKNYSAPRLEQVKMEAETPVMNTSGGNIATIVEDNVGIW